MAFASECLEKVNGNRSHNGEQARGKSFMSMPHLQNLSSCWFVRSDHVLWPEFCRVQISTK